MGSLNCLTDLSVTTLAFAWLAAAKTKGEMALEVPRKLGIQE